ncbi:MAG: hypothetical protein NTX14_00325, partial [Candidatus Nealsonbacteria bacterium]|nr:hypothetical protein [Candidatus Nealsonbacteria bacterium]
LVCEEPILPFAPDVIVPEAMEQFVDNIKRLWKSQGPIKTIEYVRDEQITKTDYAAICLCLDSKSPAIEPNQG